MFSIRKIHGYKYGKVFFFSFLVEWNLHLVSGNFWLHTVDRMFVYLRKFMKKNTTFDNEEKPKETSKKQQIF